jgi:hypothetical protein
MKTNFRRGAGLERRAVPARKLTAAASLSGRKGRLSVRTKPGAAKPRPRAKRRCRRCGCTYFNPCIGAMGQTCCWSEYDLCSMCLSPSEKERFYEGHRRPSLGRK